MKGMEFKAWLFLLVAALAGCGGAGSPGHGSLAVVVSNSKGFDANAEHGRIERFVVRVEGEGIAEPIEAIFAGDATEGVVDDVPVGEGRIVSVEAVNSNGAVIREGESFDVSVTDELTSVAVQMQAVPIFTNLANGAAVDNTRLAFRLFSDPQNPVVVEELSGGASAALVDASEGISEICLDASTGMGRLSPRLMEPGERLFVVRDVVTGRSSSALVKLLDGTKRRPAPLFGAGDNSARAVVRIGAAGKEF